MSDPVMFGGFEMSATPEKPFVVLDWKVMFCPVHMEPMRAEWPMGFPIAMVSMFNACTADPRIQELMGGDPQRLNSILREFSPMCEFLPRGLATQIVAMALTGEVYFALPEQRPRKKEHDARTAD